MERISRLAEKYGLAVIEDAAQALGATFDGKCAGSQGRRAASVSIPSRSLVDSETGELSPRTMRALARRATLLRYNGEDRATGEYHYHGQTALLDNVQAAVLDVKLRHLPGVDRTSAANCRCRIIEGCRELLNCAFLNSTRRGARISSRTMRDPHDRPRATAPI